MTVATPPHLPAGPVHDRSPAHATVPPALAEVHRGVTFGFLARSGWLDSEPAREEVRRMRETGVRWVVLTPTIMQESATSPRMFIDFEFTPADYEIEKMIDFIHGQGMRVTLRPMIECFDGLGRSQVQFPADTDGRIPGRRSDCWARWFRSMRFRSVHYARLAQRRGCEMYSLDSELDRTAHHSRAWSEVVAAVREVYAGPVSSSHCPPAVYEERLADKGFWWHDLDLLEVSFYPGIGKRPHAPVDEMVEGLQPLLARYRRLAELFGKPMLFGECGCRSTVGATAIRGSAWEGDSGGYDGQEQANLLEAVLRTFWNEPWWRGLYWWKWDEHSDRPHFRTDPAGDQGFTVWGKPAAGTMQRWFGRTDRP